MTIDDKYNDETSCNINVKFMYVQIYSYIARPLATIECE